MDYNKENARYDLITLLMLNHKGSYTNMYTIIGRRICAKCGQGYNLCGIHTDDGYDMPPILPTSENCPQRQSDCIDHFIMRVDDTESVIQKRIHDYNSNIAAVTDFYRSRGVLQTVRLKKGVADISILVKMLTSPLSR